MLVITISLYSSRPNPPTIAQKIQKQLLAMPEYQRAKNINIYLSMPGGEASTRSIVEDALRQGKKVFVPYLYKDQLPGNSKPTSVMDMVSLHSEADYNALRVDKWGIPTPDEASLHRRTRVLGDQGKAHVSAANESKHLDMMVMPGVAFDHQLRRLGHGKGFYDFFLHRYQQSIEAKSIDGSCAEQVGMPYLGKQHMLCSATTRYQLSDFHLKWV